MSFLPWMRSKIWAGCSLASLPEIETPLFRKQWYSPWKWKLHIFYVLDVWIIQNFACGTELLSSWERGLDEWFQYHPGKKDNSAKILKVSKWDSRAVLRFFQQSSYYWHKLQSHPWCHTRFLHMHDLFHHWPYQNISWYLSSGVGTWSTSGSGS